MTAIIDSNPLISSKFFNKVCRTSRDYFSSPCFAGKEQRCTSSSSSDSFDGCEYGNNNQTCASMNDLASSCQIKKVECREEKMESGCETNVTTCNVTRNKLFIEKIRRELIDFSKTHENYLKFSILVLLRSHITAHMLKLLRNDVEAFKTSMRHLFFTLGLEGCKKSTCREYMLFLINLSTLSFDVSCETLDDHDWNMLKDNIRLTAKSWMDLWLKGDDACEDETYENIAYLMSAVFNKEVRLDESYHGLSMDEKVEKLNKKYIGNPKLVTEMANMALDRWVNAWDNTEEVFSDLAHFGKKECGDSGEKEGDKSFNKYIDDNVEESDGMIRKCVGRDLCFNTSAYNFQEKSYLSQWQNQGRNRSPPFPLILAIIESVGKKNPKFSDFYKKNNECCN